MKFFYFTILVSAMWLSGCASSSQTYGPDGRVAHSLNCSGTARTWGMCYEKAGEICGAKGYDILEKSGEQGVSVAGNSSGVYGSSTFGRTMLIACKSE